MLKADDLLAMDNSELQDLSTSKYVLELSYLDYCKIFWNFRERPTTVSLDKIKRELITTTAREDGKFQSDSTEIE